MREYEIFEKIEVILQNRVVSENDLRLFKFVLDQMLEERSRKIVKTGMERVNIPIWILMKFVLHFCFLP